MIEFLLPNGQTLAVNPELVTAILSVGGGSMICLGNADDGFVVSQSYKATLYAIRVAQAGKK